jgi:peptide/nickel transport system substrate-binding protein
MRTFSGEALMTAYAGNRNRGAHPNTTPRRFAPTTRGGLHWPKWGMYIESQGSRARSATCSPPAGFWTILEEWQNATDEAERRKAWDQILAANADEVFTIGTVNGIRQPIVVGPEGAHVPKEGYYAWDPGGYIGPLPARHVLDRAVSLVPSPATLGRCRVLRRRRGQESHDSDS